jgi:hypothetical protein
VNEQIEEHNNDRKVERMLREKPEMQCRLKRAREHSEILGVPAWFLLTLEGKAQLQAWGALEIIHTLRNDAEEVLYKEETEALAAKAEAEALAADPETEALVAKVEAEALAADLDYLKPVLYGHPEMTIAEAGPRLKAETERTIRELEAREAEGHAGF